MICILRAGMAVVVVRLEGHGADRLPQLRRGEPGASSGCAGSAARRSLRPLPPQEVRKTVTIVFSDLKGSTSLGEALDPESLREVMTRYFDAMRAVLERHGGTVEKYIGDAIMAVFGLPPAARGRRAAGGARGAGMQRGARAS